MRKAQLVKYARGLNIWTASVLLYMQSEQFSVWARQY